ncbi:hypothetical protein C8J57DRAFT_320894 [Mycena rebaudengoi]|nr:hypothetical protein C8J57DRAFT_320894 [Mycena rebaudengoi]
MRSSRRVVDVLNVGVLVNNVGKSHAMPAYLVDTPVGEMTDIVRISVGATVRVVCGRGAIADSGDVLWDQGVRDDVHERAARGGESTLWWWSTSTRILWCCRRSGGRL